MSGETKEIQVIVGKALSTATLGSVRVEVSPDSNVVVYTNDGVQTKPAGAGSEAAAKGIHISISEDFNTVVLNGVTIEQAADGHLVITSAGTVVMKPAAANDTAAPVKAAPKPGDKMEDGTVFAGISPDTNKPMYATPDDAVLTYTFNQAGDYAAALDAHGHKDWRVPTKAELNVLFNNRAAIGGFDVSGSYPAGWYWSSSRTGNGNAWAQRFSDGSQGLNLWYDFSSLRCVR